jgi:RNA polymerase sigma-70 factor, ECF subfamily
VAGGGDVEREASPFVPDGFAAMAVAPGGEAVLREVLPEVYGRLRALARHFLIRERGEHTLSPTALVHEAYLRLLEQPGVSWRGRAHVVALAAHMMRRVLVNHAVARGRAKRGQGWHRVTIDTGLELASVGAEPGTFSILEVDAALEKLAALDERQARVVELRCFGGMTAEEIAQALQISRATVTREWATARLWLMREFRRR